MKQFVILDSHDKLNELIDIELIDTRVTSVCTKQVQDLSIYDISEFIDITGLLAGFEIESDYAPGDNPDDFVNVAREKFVQYWNSINTDYPWSDNPWILIVEYEAQT